MLFRTTNLINAQSKYRLFPCRNTGSVKSFVCRFVKFQVLSVPKLSLSDAPIKNNPGVTNSVT